MGTYHRALWISEGRGQSRKQRASGSYEYYLPTPLSRRDLSLDADVSGDVSRAEVAIAKLNDNAAFLHNTEGVARLLLRAESVSSSHIEGLSVGARRLLRAEFALSSKGSLRHDPNAAAIIGNIHAMENALANAASEPNVTPQTFCDIHRSLCADTPLEEWGGIVRDRQNWIGGSSYNPLGADFIPPAPEHVPELLEDLARFCNDQVISPVEQAAVAHAQFENIHPFVDGNGRVGRALVHLLLRRRALARKFVPPVSLVLATHSKDYVEGINGFAFDDSEGNAIASRKVNDWVSTFAGCCLRACEEAVRFEVRMKELRDKWTRDLGKVRAKSALDVLLDEFPGAPVFDIAMLARLTGRSVSSLSEAVERCLEVDVVKQIGASKRNRVFEVPAVIREYTLLERKLASPIGDTSAAPPVRPVPDRPKTQ